LLEEDAKAIAKLKQCEFGGYYPSRGRPAAPLFFVPDQTLLCEEAAGLGIAGPADLFGGVVPRRFLKTKAITHELVDHCAFRPDGWSDAFAVSVIDLVLHGYTAFDPADASKAAQRLLQHGTSIRLKRTACSGGRGQMVVTAAHEVEEFVRNLPLEEMTASGVLLEENLRETQTLSIGRVELDGLSIAYHGTQRRTRDNDGNAAYGGSDLVCVRGGWAALQEVAMPAHVRTGVSQARSYDEAMIQYPGFMASRRNYDVGQGLDSHGRLRSGVFESSWRAGGASPAELLAMRALRPWLGRTLLPAAVLDPSGQASPAEGQPCRTAGVSFMVARVLGRGRRRA
jgi:hypothetical protein